MIRLLLTSLLALTLFGCTTTHTQTPIGALETKSQLQQGKRYFEDGFYKRAMRKLLPLACDGNAEAQYAVGYMYYYGYGVTQDTDVGYFWIKRSADQHYLPAMQAIQILDSKAKP